MVLIIFKYAYMLVCFNYTKSLSEFIEKKVCAVICFFSVRIFLVYVSKWGTILKIKLYTVIVIVYLLLFEKCFNKKANVNSTERSESGGTWSSALCLHWSESCFTEETVVLQLEWTRGLGTGWLSRALVPTSMSTSPWPGLGVVPGL